MKFVTLNPFVLQYDEVCVPRPSCMPFNIVKKNKVYAAGHNHGITMIIFATEGNKPENKVNYFRMVPSKIVEGLVTGDDYIIDKFVEQALSGLYPDYVEDNDVYFL